MMQDYRVHVLVAERHPAVRRVLRAAIDGPFVYHEVTTALDALAKTIEIIPDVVVLDAALPLFDNLEFITQLARLARGVKILILAAYESAELARQFRDAGAHGYVVTADVGAVMVEAVRAVAEGRTFFHDHMMPLPNPLREGAPEATASARKSLTVREREVLVQLVQGRSNKETALALQISVNTIETHRARIMKKLGLHSMGDLVRYAIRNLLISP
jgi:two-component system, NarL family, response regulator NreC